MSAPPNVSRFSKHRRRIGFVAALPFLCFALATAIYYVNIHRTAAAMTESSLGAFPGPAPGDRILVLAPHCDDETLGMGGLIATARQRGIPVEVVFVTNGDGFRIAASLTLRDVSLEPSDYVRFGEHRRSEAIAALTRLGVPPANVRFLGYPDQGLKSIWDSTSDSGPPFRSRFTRADRVPYTSALSPGAPYTAQSIVDDIARRIDAFGPTDIFTTHPSDDHGDHCACASLVQAAIIRQRSSKPEPVRLHYFLIHRGDWPLPQGDHPDANIKPPAAMTAVDANWRTLRLDDSAQRAKRAALMEYRSQMDVMPRLLTSFLRRNEIFVTDDGNGTSRLEPVADDIARYAQPAADLEAVDCKVSGNALEVEARLRGSAAPGMRYLLHARAMGRGGKLQPPVVRSYRVPVTAPRSRSISFRIPLDALGRPTNLEAIWIGIEAGVNDRLPVDRTGYRWLTGARLEPEP